MRVQLFLILILLLAACDTPIEPVIPVEDILSGVPEGIVEDKVEPAPVAEPAPEPVAEPAPAPLPTPVAVVVEPEPRGDVKSIDVVLRSTNALVSVLFENGNEEFTLTNTDKDLIIGILVGKYDKTESQTRTLTTFLQEATDDPEEPEEEIQQVVETKVIELKAYSFVPEVLTIQPGTAIVWSHKDLATHTVTTSSAPESFDSGTLTRDDTFTYNFFKEGTYEYYSKSYPSMRGKIVVQE